MGETLYLRGPFLKKITPKSKCSILMWAIWHLFLYRLLYQIMVLIWFLYQNIENVVLTEVPKLMVDASELVLTVI